MNVRKIVLELSGGIVFAVVALILISACTSVRLPFDLSQFGLGVALIALALMFLDKTRVLAKRTTGVPASRREIR